MLLNTKLRSWVKRWLGTDADMKAGLDELAKKCADLQKQLDMLRAIVAHEASDPRSEIIHPKSPAEFRRMMAMGDEA